MVVHVQPAKLHLPATLEIPLQYSMNIYEYISIKRSYRLARDEEMIVHGFSQGRKDLPGIFYVDIWMKKGKLLSEMIQ